MEFGQPNYGAGYGQPPSFGGGGYYQYPVNGDLKQGQIQQPQPSGMPHIYHSGSMNPGFSSQSGQSNYQHGGYPPQSGGAGGQQMFARNYKTVPCKYFHR